MNGLDVNGSNWICSHLFFFFISFRLDFVGLDCII